MAVLRNTTQDTLPLAVKLAVAGAAAGLGWVARRQLVDGAKLGVSRWRSNPRSTATDIGLSSIGQLMFWTVGQDFIGIGMDRKWGPGLGHRIAPVIQKRLPATPAVAWTIKAIEIASDATKMPIEGKLYRELGIVPDAVAAAVTQPAWSYIEVVEKVIGILRHPERVNTPSQVEDSISSIYGTWTRHLLSLALLRYGRQYQASGVHYLGLLGKKLRSLRA